MRYARRALICALTLILTFSLISCRGERDTLSLMREFADAYGEGTVYACGIPEGERGFVGESFFAELYGAPPYEVENYALLLLPSLTQSGEAGLLLCYRAADAMTVEALCLARLRTLRTAARLAGRSFPEDAFVERHGRYVVYAALPDGERVRSLFSRLL